MLFNYAIMIVIFVRSTGSLNEDDDAAEGRKLIKGDLHFGPSSPGGLENDKDDENKDGHENTPQRLFRQPEPWPDGLIPYNFEKGVLGRGAFGEVFEGTFCNHEAADSNISVAVKTVPKECINEQTEIDFQLEALIMSKFKHPNIVQLIGVCFETNPRFIVVELLAGGDLKNFLCENRPYLNSPTSLTVFHLVRMAVDVVKGCQYLEENHFIHCDIAARNCLLTTKTDNLIVKIADFGMARDIYKNGYYRIGCDKRLPLRWMPPEAFLDGVFTSKTDVWSFGVLLWEIFTMGYVPYPGLHNLEVMRLVKAGGRLEMPTGCPNQLYELMNECWNSVAAKRPNFSTIRDVLDICIKQSNIIESPISSLLQTEKAILSDIYKSTECMTS